MESRSRVSGRVHRPPPPPTSSHTAPTSLAATFLRRPSTLRVRTRPQLTIHANTNPLSSLSQIVPPEASPQSLVHHPCDKPPSTTPTMNTHATPRPFPVRSIPGGSALQQQHQQSLHQSQHQRQASMQQQQQQAPDDEYALIHEEDRMHIDEVVSPPSLTSYAVACHLVSRVAITVVRSANIHRLQVRPHGHEEKRLA